MHRRMGRPEKYPWDKWLGGGEHKLVRGIHYSRPSEAFRQQILTKARYRDVVVITSIWRDDDDEGIYIQDAPGWERDYRP
jgi:hypothetical protein